MPKAKRKALQRAASAHAKSNVTRDPSNDRIRVATHYTMAPVARAMGFTVTGLMALCANVTDKWTEIGTSRISNDKVYAIRPEFTRVKDEFGRVEITGTLQFSIGDAGVGFTANAIALRSSREAIAERIVANLQASRGSDVNASKAMATIDKARKVIDRAIVSETAQGPVVTVVPHLGPRGPEQ